MSKTEYHVGWDPLAIYAGTLNKKNMEWKDNSEVTDEAFRAVTQFLLFHGTCTVLNIGEKKFRLKVEEIEKTYDAG